MQPKTLPMSRQTVASYSEPVEGDSNGDQRIVQNSCLGSLTDEL